MATTTAPGIAAEPMGEMNTTPLIDVLLVLLIMFIITIPVATHSVDFPLPAPDDDTPKIEILGENTVTVTPAGAIEWNGVGVSEARLALALKASQRIRPVPVLKFQPSGQAPYGASARTLGIIKGLGVTAFGFVGNEQYADFGRNPAAR